MMKSAIAEYERLVTAIAENFTHRKSRRLWSGKRGRQTELAVTGAELQSLLVLRRYEKNVMLYKNKEVYDVFKRTYDASPLSSHPEVRALSGHSLPSSMTCTKRKTVPGQDAPDGKGDPGLYPEPFEERTGRYCDHDQNVHQSAGYGTCTDRRSRDRSSISSWRPSIATPIRTLEKISRKIAEGDFSEHIEVKGKDELSSLETAFNQMEDRLKNALWSLEHTIEKLREKQAQLVEAEKLALVGKLAAGIAHEINNPLTSVLTFSNLMLEQCPPDDPRHDKLKLMARETNRARTIVRQLLNFGRETVIKPEKININQPVTEIADSLVAQDAFKGIGLEMKLGDNLPDVDADPAQIGQVVMNLLLNAIHAITPPGRIEVVTRQDREAALRSSFTDTGAGIPEEHLHKIFDPFFTTKDATKGTGLGLAVSYGIIKKHGGDIEVASTVGKGTTFTVRLPIYG